MKAALYVVPTPIGNIADMTLRSVEVLKAVDVIAAEDTRHSRTLLNHYEITTPMVSFHEHSGESAAMALADRVAQGQSVALISDAGTPLVSDPGYQLVRAVQSLDMPIVPLPGPCAAITALSAAGLPTHSFQFVGLLLAFMMILFFYRHSIKDILKTPKESFFLAIPILLMGILFYFFFKSKGF